MVFRKGFDPHILIGTTGTGTIGTNYRADLALFHYMFLYFIKVIKDITINGRFVCGALLSPKFSNDS